MNRFESVTKPMIWSTTLLLAAIVAGCGGGSGTPGVGAGPVGAACTTTGTIPCVTLGTTANYVILANTAITNTPTSVVTGDMGISPNKAASIAGFALKVDATNDFATSAQVTGRIYAPDFTGGQGGSAGTTAAKMTTAQNDKVTAYNDAAGRTPAPVGSPNRDKGAGNIPAATDFAPGTYTWVTPSTAAGNVNLNGDITLTGTATDVWIFQIAGILTQANAAKVTLIGALPQNVFWVVAGGTNIGTTAHFEGILLDKTAITLGTGATVKGRLQAQTAVTLNGTNTVTVP